MVTNIPIYKKSSTIFVPTGPFVYITDMNVKHNRVEVLKKGLQLFWTKGYSNLGVEEICRTTGMTKGAFYNAYKSKENFLLATIEVYNQINVDYLTKTLSEDPSRSIDKILNLYTAMFNQQPQKEYCGCMLNNMMSELGAINERVGNATSKNFENLVTTIEPVVRQAQQEGDISNSLDARSVTELIHTTFFGALTRAKSSKDFEQGIKSMTLLIYSLKAI